MGGRIVEHNLPSLIAGIWFIDNMPFDEEGILVIRTDGPVVRFFTSVTKPRMNQTMRLHLSADKDGHVRFRPTPCAEGSLRRVEISQTGWTMIAVRDGQETGFPCRPASPGSLPPWFEELLDKNFTMMQEPQR